MNDIFSNTGKTGEPQFALRGVHYVGDTEAHSVTCYGFLALEPCVISSLTVDPQGPRVTGSALAGMPIPAGVFLPIHFTSITLSSGQGLCLRK